MCCSNDNGTEKKQKVKILCFFPVFTATFCRKVSTKVALSEHDKYTIIKTFRLSDHEFSSLSTSICLYMYKRDCSRNYSTILPFFQKKRVLTKNFQMSAPQDSSKLSPNVYQECFTYLGKTIPRLLKCCKRVNAILHTSILRASAVLVLLTSVLNPETKI